jgi:hypothetical protein
LKQKEEMEVSTWDLVFEREQIVVEEIRFGQSLYLYIGNSARAFDDLAMGVPAAQEATSHLLGDKATDDLATLLVKDLRSPVLLAYSFPLISEADQTRYRFVKQALHKHYTKPPT